MKLKLPVLKRIILPILTAGSFTVANVIPAVAGPFDDAQKASNDQFSKFGAGASVFGNQLWALIIIVAIIGVAIQIGLSFLRTSGNLTLQDRILQTITDALPIIMGIVFMAAIIGWMVSGSTSTAPP